MKTARHNTAPLQAGPIPFLGHDAPPADPRTAAVAVLPLPYEGTVTGAKGAAQGPAALLAASAQVEFWDEALEREPCAVGITTREAPVLPAEPAAAVEAACRATGTILDQGQFPVAIGGEHSLSAGVFRALHDRDPDLGAIQIDAHADLRRTYAGTPHNHACVMARIRERTDDVLQLGIRSLSREEAEQIEAGQYAVGFMRQLHDGTFDLRAALDRLPQRVFVTLDVDALDTGLVRSTGTPDPGGFTWAEINAVLAAVFQAKRVVGLDVMELCGGDPVSAFCVARLTYRMIGWATSHGETGVRSP